MSASAPRSESILPLFAALADPSARERVAAELSVRLGVERVLVLATDPELGVLLPAPGWPQTLRGIGALRAALADPSAPRMTVGSVSLVEGRAQSFLALSAPRGVFMVLIGGTPALELVEELRIVFPLLAAALSAELAGHVAKGRADSAVEAGRQANALAHALDATRAQLEASLREAARLHEEAERARQRAALLDRVTREVVGEARDVDTVLESVARVVVPTLADACAVYVPTPEGGARLAAFVRSAGDEDARPTSTTRHLLQSGATIRDERPDPTPAIRLDVAMRGHDRPLGVIQLSVGGDRRFAPDDRSLAEELANRAAALLERQRLLEEARIARASAEAANRAKDEFLAMLGHELRNPLAPISTALALMKLRGGDAVDAERAVIERQIRHMVELVDDLLDVSRITRGKTELRRATLCVRDVVAAAAEMALPLIEERRHRLSIDVEDELHVDGDARRLAQVVSNLVTNAAKYTPDGGVIEVRATRSGERVAISVRDDGIGIDADLLPRVFDLFTQAPQTIARSTGGLGLGLAIVRRLVELHGGAVEARSDGPGRGSEFVVYLPRVDAESSATKAPASGDEADARADARRILVVDDNADSAEMLAELLGALGHEVRVANDGPGALAVLDAFTPEVALLDIGLPVMDGFELARRVRARSEGMFLVAVTGYGQQSDREATRAAGFDAHLVKPIDLRQIEHLLEQGFASRSTSEAVGRRVED